MTHFSQRALGILLIAALVLVGCDDTSTGTEDTIIIGTDADPVEVEFSFNEFSASDVNDGAIELTSTNTDDLGRQIEQIVGASRGDVVSAELRSVRLERLTGNFGAVRPKVFSYLGSARVYYGNDTSAPFIAQRTPISDDAEVVLDINSSDITNIVRNGARPLTLRLDVNDPSLIGTGDDVEITVSYRIEVTG